MTFDGDKAGKKVVNRVEYTFDLHKCPECGEAFAVTTFTLKTPDTDCWTWWSQTPKYCYMCGASMVAADDPRGAGVVA